MKLSSLAASLFILFLSSTLWSCAAAGVADAGEASMARADGSADEAESEEDKAKELAELKEKHALAGARLAIANMEAEDATAKQTVRLRHAAAEVELAQAKLAQFDAVDAPNRLASEGLDLRSTKDRAQEAAEELAQIEIMYKDQDLDDLTAEFVVSRGRRNAERAAARIAIQEAAFQSLEQNELPQERAQLELTLERKQADQEAAEREGKIGAEKQAVAVTEAENEVARLERELVELQKTEKP